MSSDERVEAAYLEKDLRGLLELWEAWSSRAVWLDVAEKAQSSSRPESIEVAAKTLRELPEVTALDALRANKRLVERMTSRRWYVMRDAREAGATWDEIGEALGMSRQAAHEWYRKKIADQQEHVGDLHDSARAQLAL